MRLTATCHCGGVQVTVPYRPRRLTSCNCSICRRLGTLWAYYPRSRVRIRAPRGGLQKYVWGDRMLRLARCRICGCVTHWEPMPRRYRADRMGVNARNFEPDVIAGVRIRRLDGASTWKFLD